MLLKILEYVIDDFGKFYEFLKSQNEIEFDNTNNEKFKLNLNFISEIQEDFVKIEYSFQKPIEIPNLFLFYGIKSKLIFFQIKKETYSFFSKFLKSFEKYLEKNNIYLYFKNFIPNREKIWDFIISSNQILNLEIMTEKGLIYVEEDWNQIKKNFILDIKDYPVNWAQLVYEIKDFSFQFHFFINELNIPDDIDINKIIYFFKFFEIKLQ